ncbi:MAG: ABC transporter permease [Gammaproteobacteria bacterium]|nr:ABC transporter permease [Gammaproteobacteria bacterium]
MNQHFSLRRLWGLLIKEWHQFRRDYTTFAMILGIPIIQIILFGLAINTNPKYLPSAVINADNGPFSRSLIQALENTQYFKFIHANISEKKAEELMRGGKILFVLTIPSDFSYRIVKHHPVSALLEADGTDPITVAYAVSAANAIISYAFKYDLVGPLQTSQTVPLVDLKTQVRYNPERVTSFSIVPGLIGMILTMTLVMVTAMALTREQERGTLESLLITPALPIEVIFGKVLPYIIVGYLQAIFIILLAKLFFQVPIKGSMILLFTITMPFILANLFIGISISTVTKTQLEASQLSTFFFLPSILLSGLAFPFQGMPTWAQWLGNTLPMTHFNNITRAIMLKGSGLVQIWQDLWPILIFMLVALFIALKRYRQTLD